MIHGIDWDRVARAAEMAQAFTNSPQMRAAREMHERYLTDQERIVQMLEECRFSATQAMQLSPMVEAWLESFNPVPAQTQLDRHIASSVNARMAEAIAGLLASPPGLIESALDDGSELLDDGPEEEERPAKQAPIRTPDNPFHGGEYPT